MLGAIQVKNFIQDLPFPLKIMKLTRRVNVRDQVPAVLLYFGPWYISISIFFRSQSILGLGDALSVMACSTELLLWPPFWYFRLIILWKIGYINTCDQRISTSRFPGNVIERNSLMESELRKIRRAIRLLQWKKPKKRKSQKSKYIIIVAQHYKWLRNQFSSLWKQW